MAPSAKCTMNLIERRPEAAPPYGRPFQPHTNEGVLRQVLGRLAFAHHTVGQGEGGAAVAVVEQGQRLRAAAVADTGNQILLGEERVASSVGSHTVRSED